MNKKLLGKIIVVVVIILIFIIVNASSITEDFFLQKSSRDFVFTKTVNVDKERIFRLMADVEQYPNIMPKNVIDVHIINQSGNVIFAEETISELGVETKILTKHTIFPYEKHVIEILDGSANGTKIVVEFFDEELNTTIKSDIKLIASGPLSILTQYMQEHNFESVHSTVIRAFVNYLE